MADLTTYDPLFLALFENVDGTGELSGSGYARKSITNDVTIFSVDGSGNRTSIVPIAMVPASGSDWTTVRSIGFFDLSTAGTRLAWVRVPPFTVRVGENVVFPAGALGYTSGGSGAITPALPSLANIPRVLYLYENRGIEALAVLAPSLARSLFLYENRGIQAALAVLARSLFLYENRGIQLLIALARSLYAYEATRDGEVFPWLMRIAPTEQYRGGQVDLYGDGFGEILEVAGDVGTTVTTSSVNGANIGGNAADRVSTAWVSNDGAGAWIRFTFGAPKTIVGIALEGRQDAANSWGVPQLRFSDGGANVSGVVVVPKPATDGSDTSAEYPVGHVRLLYALAAPRTTSYVEVRVQSGGAGTNRGLREVWIYEDLDQAAESSSAVLNDGLVSETTMGIVVWANRSPGLWPANGGLPIERAATVTVPMDAESGLVIVEEDL